MKCSVCEEEKDECHVDIETYGHCFVCETCQNAIEKFQKEIFEKRLSIDANKILNEVMEEIEEARQLLLEKIRNGEINCDFFNSSISDGEEVAGEELNE